MQRNKSENTKQKKDGKKADEEQMETNDPTDENWETLTRWHGTKKNQQKKTKKVRNQGESKRA